MVVVQKMKVNKLPIESTVMFDHLSQCLEDWEKVIPRSSHSGLIEQWKNEMKQYIIDTYPCDDDENERYLVDSISSGVIAA